MKPYLSYKDSGVEWIGEFPSNWESKRLKHISNFQSGYSFKSEDFSIEEKIPVIRIGDVGDRIDFSKCVKLPETFLDEHKDFIIKKNDIMVGMTGGTIGKSGKYIYDEPSLLNQRVCLLRNHSSILNGLLYHYVKSEIFKRYIFFYCYGGGQDNIGREDILNMIIPLPPKETQTQIVSFLDTKTQKIDELIERTEKKIELLKEKRTSLINHCVTKGLNPNVEMKDSGVEWIGEIPSHWETKKVKYIFEIKKIISGVEGYDVLSVTQQGIKVKDIITGKGQLSLDYAKYQMVNIGDFVMNHMDLLTGYVDISKYAGVTSPDYRVFKVNDEKCVNSYYLYLFQMGYKNKIFYGFGQGSSMFGRWRLPSNQFNNFKFPYPDNEEQQQIVEYLYEQTQKIDYTIEKETKRSELLKEYRQSLISEVVTGKIDVREENPA